jgi:transposase
MISLPSGKRIWISCAVTDLRKGFDGLAGLIQTQLTEDPLCGQLFVFRGRRGDRIKIPWWSGDRLCLFA